MHASRLSALFITALISCHMDHPVSPAGISRRHLLTDPDLPITISNTDLTPLVTQRFDMSHGILYQDGSCVSVVMSEVPAPPADAHVQSQQYEVVFHTSASDLFASLSVEASLSAGGVFWDASVSSSYLHETRSTSDSVFVTVHAKVVLQGQQSKPSDVNFNKKGNDLLSRGSVSDFLAACSSGYVSGITRGGEFWGVLEFKRVSTQLRHDISFAFNGGTPYFETSGSLVSKVKRFTSNTDYSITLKTIGGKVMSNITPDTLLEKADHFFADAVREPGIISFQIEPYSSVLGAGSKLRGVQQVHQVLKEISRVYIDTLVARNTLLEQSQMASLRGPNIGKYLDENACSKFFDSHEFDRESARLGTLLIDLNRSAQACMSLTCDDESCTVPDECTPPAILQTATAQVPVACMRTCSWDLSSDFPLLTYNDEIRRDYLCGGLLPGTSYLVKMEGEYRYPEWCPPERNGHKWWPAHYVDGGASCSKVDRTI